jgi:3-oxoacyl-[acyl-carrier protein] reductase
LEGRVVLVTGGSRGIGRAIVEELARSGARVAFTFRERREAAQDVVGLARAAGAETEALALDIRDFKQTQQVIAQTVERFGRLDALVNNAGIVRDKALMLMEPSDWHDVIETNLTGVFNACRAAIVGMLKQRSGRIVNITSVAGLVGGARQVNYAASKAGIIGLTKALAREVAAYNVTVNAVAPGYIETDMTGSLTDKRKGEVLTRIPVGRLGQPAEVAGVVRALLEDSAAYITGQVIVVDGGLTLS